VFERYTEKARRAIFFARYEASTFGTPYIGTEQLLLGWLRETKSLSAGLPIVAAETIRARIEAHCSKEKSISTSVDLPLSEGSQHVLKSAAEEADLR
jgi:ATP-dependent Clp protease ATP-binding subunit ClpC